MTIRNNWLVIGSAVVGLSAAACSSSNDDGIGTGGLGGAPTGSGGALSSAGGSSSASSATGGSSAAAGQSSIDLATYCNGLFAGRNCGTTQVSADVRTVNMLLVVDSSGSMTDPPVAGAATKWAILQTALQQSLTANKDLINFGLLLYPYKQGGLGPNASTDMTAACAVPTSATEAVNIPIGAGSAAVNAIIQKLSVQEPKGGTPTADALNRAYDYFAGGDGKLLQGTRWVVLATDGGPNCNPALSCNADRCTQNMDGDCPSGNCCAGTFGAICLDDAETKKAILKLNQLGVKTFVIGIPGSEAYASVLNECAVTGGVPAAGATSYYAVSAANALNDLTDAFSKITTQLVRSCDIPLKETPKVGPDQINVAIDCVPVHAATAIPDGGAGDGFYIDFAQTPAHLKLVGATCDRIMATGANKVDVIAGCPRIN